MMTDCFHQVYIYKEKRQQRNSRWKDVRALNGSLRSIFYELLHA